MNVIKDWWALAIVILGWIISGTVQWTSLKNKINGLGGRVKRVEESCASGSGRMDRIERELNEYRRDASDAKSTAARVEKSVEDLRGEIQQGNLTIGSQLHGIERLIQDKDQKTTNRLVRIETVQQIEKKVGPLPAD